MWFGGFAIALLSACVVFGCSVVLSLSTDFSGEITQKAHDRHARGTTVYHLDILVLVDKANYMLWYNRTQTSKPTKDRESEAFVNITTYFTLFLKEVSDLYRSLSSSYLLKFQPVDFYIETQTSVPKWTWDNVTGTVDVVQVQSRLMAWLKAAKDLPSHDFVMLFTGKDLAYDGDGNLSGQATCCTMCKGDNYVRVALIEDRGGFQSVFTAAHELAHREVATCLETKLPQSDDVPDVSGIIPGQLYDREAQCQHMYGPQSSYCFFGNLSTICTEMSCTSPSGSSPLSCNVHVAATGTSCGNKQWCQAGECVPSADAPELTDACIKDRAVNVKGMSCEQLVTAQPALCYEGHFPSNCCQSCRKIHSGIAGCPYGDRRRGCSPDQCHQIVPSGLIVDEDCCHTCRFDKTTWTCRDVDSVDGKTCASALQVNGKMQGCYNHTLAFYCCNTCRLQRRQDRGKGCEYGDRLLRGCPTSSDGSTTGECDLNLCCHTCRNKKTEDANGGRWFSLLVSVVVPPILALVIFLFSRIVTWAS